LEADLVVGPHRFEHIGLPIILECFNEASRRAADVPEMDEMDLLLLAEVPNPVRDVSSHRGECSLAERQPVHRAGVEVQGFLETFRCDENAGDAAQRGDGWVIRVQCQFHPGLLGDRNDRFEKVPETLPQLLLRYGADLGRSGLFHEFVVIARRQCTAAGRRGDRGPCPIDDGHPVPAPDRYLQLAHVAEQGDDPLDLLVAPGQTEPRPVHRWRCLDHRDRDTGLTEALKHEQQRHEVPGTVLLGWNVARHDRLRNTGRTVGLVTASDVPGECGDGMGHTHLERQAPAFIRPGWKDECQFHRRTTFPCATIVAHSSHDRKRSHPDARSSDRIAVGRPLVDRLVASADGHW